MSHLPNILVVDDNETYLLYLEIILYEIQAKIIKADSAAKALELTRDVELTLAIIDVQMPVMNGFELALQLNAQRSDNKIPIIFLTAASPNDEKVLKGYEAGAADFIIKPLNKSILISKINIFLELYRQKQRIIEKTEKLKVSETRLLQAKKQLEQVNQHLINAIEEERTNISYKVHDELGQSMTALKMDLSWVKQNLNEQELSERKLDRMIETVNEVISKVQRISIEMHPGILDDLGLIAAIEWYCKDFETRTGVLCTLALEEVTEEISTVNLAFFRILQEAMTNVIRHSKATSVSIELINMRNEMIMMISDNGTGIPAGKLTATNSFGIMSMRQRAQLCGGNIDFSNIPGNGLSIEVKIPKKLKSYEDSYC
ncbi:MAG: response regulator [Paludibacter sp.]|nr:response regulator [Paludibacter sp.]